MTYKIVRVYFNNDIPRRTIKTGLTLEEAQAHCHDPETSSKTCRGAIGRRRTKLHGAWFDSYEAEKQVTHRRRGRYFNARSDRAKLWAF